MEENKGSGFLPGVILGCLLGAALALFLSPKTRGEVIDKLKEGFLEGKEKVKDLTGGMEGFIEKGKGAFQSGREKLKEAISKYKESIEDIE